MPATLGLIHLLSGRGAILGHVGGGLMLLAQLGSAALVGLDLALLEISDEGADRGQMIALAERMMGSAGFTILLLVALFGSFLGLAFLAAGLWRARVVPAWPSVLILLFVVMEFTVIGVSEVLESVALVLLAIGLGWVSIKVLSMSDAEWHEASVGDRRQSAGAIATWWDRGAAKQAKRPSGGASSGNSFAAVCSLAGHSDIALWRFRERGLGELRRTPLPRTLVNKRAPKPETAWTDWRWSPAANMLTRQASTSSKFSPPTL